MKFLVDESLPAALCKWLIVQGHEAEHVVRVRLGGRADQEVRARASARGEIIITKDRDYIEGPRQLGLVQVVWVRLGNVNNSQLIDSFAADWADTLAQLKAGKTVVHLPSAIGETIVLT